MSNIDANLTIKNYRCFTDENPTTISLRSGLTGFIGVNNSGKSSLLKFFYEFRDLFRRYSDADTRQKTLIPSPINFHYSPSIVDMTEVFSNTNSRDLSIEIQFYDRDRPSEVKNAITPDKLVINITRNTNISNAQLYYGNKRIYYRNGVDYSAISDTAYKFPDHFIDLSDFKELFSNLHNTFYIPAFRNALDLEGNQVEYFDIIIGKPVVTTWRDYKTGNSIALNNLAKQLTQDIQRMFEFNNLEIDAADNLQTFKIRIDNKPYRLVDIGSGFVHFLVTFISIAQKKPYFIMIDEPEQNLHPRLQVDFLTTIGSYAQHGLYFATHSVGLARQCGDYIYSVSRLSEGQSLLKNFESTPRLSEFLGELGFSTFRELGFSKVLLVEGPTDIKTIQQFLRLYHKDHEILVLPLGGGAMINSCREYELTEIKRITNSIFALIDSEKLNSEQSLSPERQAFIDLCSRIGIQCHSLDRRAIENYLVDRAIKLAKSQNYQELSHYQKLSEATIPWGKHENWMIARHMNLDDLSGTDLGCFLNNI